MKNIFFIIGLTVSTIIILIDNIILLSECLVLYKLGHNTIRSAEIMIFKINLIKLILNLFPFVFLSYQLGKTIFNKRTKGNLVDASAPAE